MNKLFFSMSLLFVVSSYAEQRTLFDSATVNQVLLSTISISTTEQFEQLLKLYNFIELDKKYPKESDIQQMFPDLARRDCFLLNILISNCALYLKNKGSNFLNKKTLKEMSKQIKQYKNQLEVLSK